MDEKQVKTIAYLRVSTVNQDLTKNRADILALANEKSLGKLILLKKRRQEKFLGTSVKLLMF